MSRGIPVLASRLGFAPIALRFNMTWEIRDPRRRARLALFITRDSHCLFDILARHQAGEWRADIPLVIGNRDDLHPLIAQSLDRWNDQIVQNGCDGTLVNQNDGLRSAQIRPPGRRLEGSAGFR